MRVLECLARHRKQRICVGTDPLLLDWKFAGFEAEQQ